jgi:hypothetical protein
MTPMTPQQRYQDLVDELTAAEGIEPPGGGRGFGRDALRYHGKIFAMLVRGQLVLKLPRGRVDELVAAGHGVRFDAGRGTAMKEWLSLSPESALSWPLLARQALDFVRDGLAGPSPSPAGARPAAARISPSPAGGAAGRGRPGGG